jgi:hypothetical protein
MIFMGCGAQDFDPKSLLSEYRVIGIEAEPPTLTLSDESVIKVIDFHPADVDDDVERPEVTYTWRLCPLSLGSAVRYECFIDELELEGEGPELTVSPAVLLAQLGDIMSQLEQAAEGLGEAGASVEMGYLDVYLKLTASPQGATPLEVVKRLTLNLSPDAPLNTNPTFEGEGVVLNSDLNALKVGEEVELTALISATASERYSEPSSEGDTVEQQEELIIGWAVSAGELDGPYSLIDDPTTTLTLPDDPQVVRVFVTVRDGRGGLAVKQLDLMVSE